MSCHLNISADQPLKFNVCNLQVESDLSLNFRKIPDLFPTYH